MVGFPNKPIGFPTKNDHFGVFWGYHHLRKHPNIGAKSTDKSDVLCQVPKCVSTSWSPLVQWGSQPSRCWKIRETPSIRQPFEPLEKTPTSDSGSAKPKRGKFQAMPLWNDMVPEVGNFQVLWHPKWWAGITISTLGCISIISLQISQEEMENWMGEVHQPAPPVVMFWMKRYLFTGSGSGTEFF